MRKLTFWKPFFSCSATFRHKQKYSIPPRIIVNIDMQRPSCVLWFLRVDPALAAVIRPTDRSKAAFLLWFTV